MKYIVLLCDGMADHKLPELENKTPMAVAVKPNMDKLAKKSIFGLVKTVADGLKPDSDIANLSVLGYDPKICYKGRSPLEAASIGVELKPADIAVRCNLVTLSDEPVFEQKTMVNYCADDISTEEAAEIIKTVNDEIGNDLFKFYSGVSYRHCLIWDCESGKNPVDVIIRDLELTPPHNITGKEIGEYLKYNENTIPLLELMKKSYNLLENHPVNIKRRAAGHKPANSIWLWGAGLRTELVRFDEKYGIKGAMISAVDLLKGIALLSGMEVIHVPGATGYIDTNFEGKMQGALDALDNGNDFVYIHVEAPDECGHRFEIQNKIRSIELIDEQILAPLLEKLDKFDDYKILILPDHATPVKLGKHVPEPVPFLIYHRSAVRENDLNCFDEENASKGVYIEKGTEIMKNFIS